MTKERLQTFPLTELKKIADEVGVEIAGPYRETIKDRQAIISLILEAYRETKSEREEQNNLPIKAEEKKYEITRDGEVYRCEKYEYPIPAGYDETKVVLMVRDPHWAFAYWDIKKAKAREIKSYSDFESLLLRVYEVDNEDLSYSDTGSSFDIPIQFTDNSWYIYLPDADHSYFLELSFQSGGRYQVLTRSNIIRTPRETISECGAVQGGKMAALIEEIYHQSRRSSVSSITIPQRIIG
jgi:hypothetical protein